MIRLVKSLIARIDAVYREDASFNLLKARLLVGFSAVLIGLMALNLVKLWWVQPPAIEYRLLTNGFIVGAAGLAWHWVLQGRLQAAGNVLVIGAVVPIHGLLLVVPVYEEPVAAALLLFSFDLVFLMVALAFATQRVAVLVFAFTTIGFIWFNQAVVFTDELAGSLDFAARTLRRDGVIAMLAAFSIGLALVRMVAAANRRSHEALIAARASHNQLEQLVEARTHDLVEATQRADDASRAKSDFLANMSHEIRTPLNGIIAASELIRRNPQLPPDAEEHARLVTESGELLLKLLGDILDFSKIEAGELSLESHPFAVRSLLADTMALVASVAEEKNLHMVHSVDPDLAPYYSSDSFRLRQILLNLLSNAVKFTPPGGKIELRAEQEISGDSPPRVRFSVRDTGIGMNDETMRRIFKRFTQADSSTTRRFGGTGLGLAISARLVEMMGSKLEVESESSQGSVFGFALALAPATTGPARPKSGAPLTAPLGLQVLLAEDNPVNRKILTVQLRELGCNCVVATDGVEALAALQTGALPDVIMMDCHMPNMDGWEATRRIRSWASEPDCSEHGRQAAELPIIALTAATLPEERARCHAVGMNYFLSKPVRLAELQAMLVQVPKRTSTQSMSEG